MRINLLGANVLGYACAMLEQPWPQTARDMVAVQRGLPTRAGQLQARLHAFHVERQERAAREAGLL